MEDSLLIKNKYWWLGKCGHEWEALLENRINGTGCPVCSGRKVLASYNDLATTDPNVATEWHPTKNGDWTAKHAKAGSNKKVWWQGKCGHEWEATPNDRTGRGDKCRTAQGKEFLRV